MPWYFYLAIIAFLLIYKFINNLWRYLWIRRLKKVYSLWLHGQDNDLILWLVAVIATIISSAFALEIRTLFLDF